MDYILKGTIKSLQLIFYGDQEIWDIALLSVFVSMSAVLLSAFFFAPLGVTLGVYQTKGVKIVSRLLGTLMSVPSIFIGLIVFLLLARRGPFGEFQLLYTKRAMIIAQCLLVSPLILGLVYPLAKTEGMMIKETGKTLGATPFQIVFLILKELRGDIFVIIATAFGRAISEVGAVTMVGGNIKDKTRVMTTAIALNNSMGEYEQAIALGILLLVVSFIVNLLIFFIKERKERE